MIGVNELDNDVRQSDAINLSFNPNIIDFVIANYDFFQAFALADTICQYGGKVYQSVYG